MKIDCVNCGSIYKVEFNDDETTEEFPLFCSFCGESIDGERDEKFLDKLIVSEFEDEELDDFE